RAVAGQPALPLGLAPDGVQEWPKRLVTLRSSESVPFWQALDRLCEAAKIHYTLGPQVGPGSREASFGIAFADGLAPGVTSDTGPFRVEFLSLHYQRDRELRPFPGLAAAPASEQFRVQMQVQAEPRLMIGQAGNLRLIEAIDDAGQSLLLPSPPQGAAEVEDLVEFSPGPFLQLTVPLKYPARPGRM